MPLPVITPAVPGVAQPAGKWVFQVDTTGSLILGTGTWLTVFGGKQINPSKSDDMVDTTDLDTGMWKANQLFMSEWGVAVDLTRKKYASAFDAGQEFIRAANDNKALLHVRYFDRTGGTEAYEGFGFATWENQGGGNEADEKVKVNFKGNGVRTPIANPVAVNSAPTVGSATPSAQTAGKIVTITGSNFTGATDVKFGAVSVAALSYNIVNDNTIAAVMPAGSAGAAAVTVINGVGTSNALGYTRGA